MSVTVQNITKIYGEQKALDNVSFSVDKGQVVGLLGPNGAGKSTLMKIITCFIPQTEGTVTVCGEDVTENSIRVRQQVGYLPEHNPLYPDMYVKEYLGFVAGLYHVVNPSARISEMIELTGLGLEQKKKIGTLSKGYRQRVGLAQALIHDPRVLILDEPTSGLDPNQLSEIRTLIRTTGKEKTVILSTHIMQEVEAICNRVIIINRGKIVADENTGVLQQHAGGNSFLVEFDKTVSKKQLLGISGVSSAEALKENQWRLVSSGGTDIRQPIFHFAVENNLAVLSLQKEERSLEDIFQNLTRQPVE
jgi:ABC-2 type transport system ATP-binding protein